MGLRCRWHAGFQGEGCRGKWNCWPPGWSLRAAESGKRASNSPHKPPPSGIRHVCAVAEATTNACVGPQTGHEGDVRSRPFSVASNPAVTMMGRRRLYVTLRKTPHQAFSSSMRVVCHLFSASSPLSAMIPDTPMCSRGNPHTPTPQAVTSRW